MLANRESLHRTPIHMETTVPARATVIMRQGKARFWIKEMKKELLECVAVHNLPPSLSAFLKKFLLMFKYNCLYFLPTTLPSPQNPTFHLLSHCPLALSMCPLHMFLDNPSSFLPHYPLPTPLWLLSVCSIFQCLWLYFVCFVLFIRFHL